ncbi:MAG: transposase [Bdellovibrionota bacterium]
MPHQKRQFENGEIYHITVRRIGNELLSGDEQDLYRLIYGIYEFNNAKHVSIARRRQQRASFKKAVLGQTSYESVLGQTSYTAVEQDKRDKVVEVLAFALMPNHIHLLVRQLVNNGVSIFMQKFGSGYATWFKEKYNQKGKGHFFTARFNAVRIEDNEQLRTVLVYIFTNPVALIEPGWKERGVASIEKSIEFLEQKYRWSSYWDCLGKKNFPSIIEKEKDFVLEMLGGPEGCKKAVDGWIKYKGELRRLLAKSFTIKIINQLE